MTLIASTRNFKRPFLLSDLLWTVKDGVGDQEKVVYRELKQKMYIINDTACIVFTGYHKEIKGFLEDIKKRFKEIQVTHNRLHKFLKKYDLEQKFSGSGFFITYFQNLKKTNVFVHQFFFPKDLHIVDRTNFSFQSGMWNVMEDNLLDEIAVCGSGAEKFIENVRQARDLHSNIEKGEFINGLQANTTLIAQTLLQERSEDPEISKSYRDWGIGYEAAYYDGKKYNKLDDIAYVLNYGELNRFSKVTELIPKLIMYYKYIDDVLYITEIGLRNFIKSETETHLVLTFEKGEFQVSQNEIPPIDQKATEYKPLPPPFFETDQVAMSFWIQIRQGFHYEPGFYNLGPEVTISFLRNGTLIITIDKKIDKDIKTLTESKFGHPA
jgi:hypothetical protein